MWLTAFSSFLSFPASAKFLKSDPHQAVVAYTSGGIFSFDTRTGQLLKTFAIPPEVESQDDSTPSTVESRGRIFSLDVSSAPDVVATAWEDRSLRFYDPDSGVCVHSMVAHEDAVSCVAIDHSGLYCVTGGACLCMHTRLLLRTRTRTHTHTPPAGHDRSVRVWDMTSKVCQEETTTHRKKYDEAVHGLAWHQSLPYFAR